MVVDFKDLKKIVEELIINKYDHSWMIWRNENRLTGIPEIDEAITTMRNDDVLKDFNIQLVNFRPTAENMCIRFAKDLSAYLRAHNKKFRVVKLRIYETDTSYAEWEYEEPKSSSAIQQEESDSMEDNTSCQKK